MTNNPLINALLAGGYIVAIVLTISSFPHLLGEEKETILIPMAMLSLLVLSVSVMATIFFFKPVQMYLDGAKTEAAKLFLHTVMYFAGLTFIIFIAMITVMKLS